MRGNPAFRPSLSHTHRTVERPPAFATGASGVASNHLFHPHFAARAARETWWETIAHGKESDVRQRSILSLERQVDTYCG